MGGGDNLLITIMSGGVPWHGGMPPCMGPPLPPYPPLRMSKCRIWGDNAFCKTNKIFGKKWSVYGSPPITKTPPISVGSPTYNLIYGERGGT
jgi:hypothetical protein